MLMELRASLFRFLRFLLSSVLDSTVTDQVTNDAPLGMPFGQLSLLLME